MKSFADPGFFRVLDTLLSNAGAVPGTFKTHWKEDGGEFERSKHSCTAEDYSFTVEVCHLTHAGSRPWRLMAVKEYWHLGNNKELPRQVRWAKLLAGQRRDALAWFKLREAEIERRWAETSDRVRPLRSSGGT